MEKGWNYCPKCGEEKKGFFRNPFKGFGEKLFTKSFDKMFKQVFDSMQEVDLESDGSKNFVIKMSNLDGVPDVQVFNSKKKPVVKKRVQPRMSNRVLKNVEEPEAKLRDYGNSLFVELTIPSVKSINDVEIVKLGESVEIRAFGKGKSYFKMISVPKASNVLKKELKDGKLFVELG